MPLDQVTKNTKEGAPRAMAAALAESALESRCEEHKPGPWECTPSHFDGLYDPGFGSDDDFDNPHGDWLDFGSVRLRIPPSQPTPSLLLGLDVRSCLLCAKPLHQKRRRGSQSAPATNLYNEPTHGDLIKNGQSPSSLTNLR
jgi:hypothetical protein